MRTKKHCVIARIACLGILLLLSPLHAMRPPEGFTPLFNAKDLSGWHGNNPHVTNKTLDREGALTEATVRVQGSRIRVELNGTVILDTDVADITEFMNEKLTSNIPPAGYLGFAGHGDRVAFRKLFVKAL